MDIFKNNLVIGVLALIIIGGAGAYYLAGDSGADNALLVSENETGNNIDRELLNLLLELRSLKLDPAVFSSSVFQSFQDFSQQIPNEPYGRPNPFAPVGVDIEPEPANTNLPVSDNNSTQENSAEGVDDLLDGAENLDLGI